MLKVRIAQTGNVKDQINLKAFSISQSKFDHHTVLYEHFRSFLATQFPQITVQQSYFDRRSLTGKGEMGIVNV